MTPFQNILSLARFQQLHLAGRFLVLSIIFIPTIRVFTYPPLTGNLLEPIFYIMISLIEILFIFILLITKWRHGYPINHLPAILWIGFLIWAAVALFNIPSMPLKTGGIIVTAQFFIHFFFFVAVSSYLKTQPQAGRILIFSILLSAVVFMPFFWLKLYGAYDSPDFDWTWSLPGFENVRHLDYFLGSLATILGLSLLTKSFKKSSALLASLIFLMLFVCWLMLFWSGGRGSSVAAAAAIGGLLIFFKPPDWKRILLVNFFVMILAAATSIFLPVPNGSYGIFRFLTKITEVDSIAAFSAGRIFFWVDAINIWKENIWFGIGAGQTKTVIQSASGTYGQPHNILIQAMLAWGVIGGMPFLGGIFTTFWTKGWEFHRASDQIGMMPLIAYGLALSTTINALVDGTLYYPFPIFLFVIAVAVTRNYNHKSIIAS
ncbi:MAG: O-antigen ligase family protein [Emcibacter sp.]|nr:O-antigen ligase family protein [Emcibacter sp.]